MFVRLFCVVIVVTSSALGPISQSTDCSIYGCQHDGKCNFTSGVCTCPKTYEGDQCELDVNECYSTPSPCGNRSCHNTQGSYFCGCPNGTSSDGIPCEDSRTNACANSPCMHGGTCATVDSIAGYVCSCVKGFVGKRCEVDAFTLKDTTEIISTVIYRTGAGVWAVMVFALILYACFRKRQQKLQANRKRSTKKRKHDRKSGASTEASSATSQGTSLSSGSSLSSISSNADNTVANLNELVEDKAFLGEEKHEGTEDKNLGASSEERLLGDEQGEGSAENMESASDAEQEGTDNVNQSAFVRWKNAKKHMATERHRRSRGDKHRPNSEKLVPSQYEWFCSSQKKKFANTRTKVMRKDKLNSETKGNKTKVNMRTGSSQCHIDPDTNKPPSGHRDKRSKQVNCDKTQTSRNRKSPIKVSVELCPRTTPLARNGISHEPGRIGPVKLSLKDKRIAESKEHYSYQQPTPTGQHSPKKSNFTLPSPLHNPVNHNKTLKAFLLQDNQADDLKSKPSQKYSVP